MDKQLENTRIKKGVMILLWLVLLVFFVYSFQKIIDLGELSNPSRRSSIIRILTHLSSPNISDGETRRQVAAKMLETIQIAFLATAMSTFFAIPFTYLSARSSSFWGRGLNILLQPIVSAVRAVHPLILTPLAVVFVGINPTAGVLALTLFSTAVLVGIFSEFAQQHMSLNWSILLKMYFPGLAFKHLPVNILIASVLGFMGAGGIGTLLSQNIGLADYENASVAILACIITIGSLDLISRAVWRKILSHKTSLTSTAEAANSL